jgi:hypothetical protein
MKEERDELVRDKERQRESHEEEIRYMVDSPSSGTGNKSGRKIPAEMKLLRLQQHKNEKQIQYWKDQYNKLSATAHGGSTLVASSDASSRSGSHLGLGYESTEPVQDQLRGDVQILQQQKDLNEKQIHYVHDKSFRDSDEGLLAEIKMLKKQQDWNENQIQYWRDRWNQHSSSDIESGTVIASPDLNLRSRLFELSG